MNSRALNRAYLAEMQRADAVYLQNTLDWARLIIRGPAHGDIAMLYKFQFGPYDVLKTFRPVAPPTLEELKADRNKLVVAPCARLDCEERNELYRQAFERGAAFMAGRR